MRRPARNSSSLKGHRPDQQRGLQPGRQAPGQQLPGGQTVKVWDAQTGQELLSFKGTSAYVSSVAFSPDGKRLASASWAATVKVWDAQTGQELLSFKAAAQRGFQPRRPPARRRGRRHGDDLGRHAAAGEASDRKGPNRSEPMPMPAAGGPMRRGSRGAGCGCGCEASVGS